MEHSRPSAARAGASSFLTGLAELCYGSTNISEILSAPLAEMINKHYRLTTRRARCSWVHAWWPLCLMTAQASRLSAVRYRAVSFSLHASDHDKCPRLSIGTIKHATAATLLLQSLWKLSYQVTVSNGFCIQRCAHGQHRVQHGAAYMLI